MTATTDEDLMASPYATPAMATDADAAHDQPDQPERLAAIVARLAPPMPTDRLLGWVITGAIFAVALICRLWRLGQPNHTIFDEVYYPHDAFNLLHHGYELDKNGPGPGFVVHPPLGKWMIALGQASFGNNPFGWRIAAAICGSIAVLVLARVARRMFRSTLLGGIAGLLLALDGLELVLSRTGLLDIFLLFWVLLALGCLVLDRDQGRTRLAAKLSAGAGTRWPGPAVGVRWWRLATGICLGAACAVKWSGVYYIVAFALLAAAWDVGARRTAGISAPVRAALARDWWWLIPAYGVLPVTVYLTSWTGWFLSNDAWDRHFHGRHGIWGSLLNLAEYHRAILYFHTHLHDAHRYASRPFSWLVMGKPVAFSVDYPKFGERLYGQTCHVVGGCYSEVLGVGTPAIWWTATACLPLVAGYWFARRDWRAALILVGFAAGFVPWLFSPNRTMFVFYALPYLPFTILGITLIAGLVIGREDASENRRLIGAIAVGGYLMIVLVNFVWLHPILVGDLISPGAWRARVSDWFPSWV